MTKFSSVITLSTSRIADPASAGIDRFVGLEHIEPENLHIRSWGLVADGTTFTSTFKRGQVFFGKRTSKVTFQQNVVQNTTICYNSINPSR
jgi:type I restriction enzyme, S subunit